MIRSRFYWSCKANQRRVHSWATYLCRCKHTTLNFVKFIANIYEQRTNFFSLFFGLLIFCGKSCLKVGGAAYTQVFTVGMIGEVNINQACTRGIIVGQLLEFLVLLSRHTREGNSFNCSPHFNPPALQASLLFRGPRVVIFWSVLLDLAHLNIMLSLNSIHSS